LDEQKSFLQQCNSSSLNLFSIETQEDESQLKTLIENHFLATNSLLAKRLLNNWKIYLPKFKKVLPEEYRKALIRLKQEQLEIA